MRLWYHNPETFYNMIFKLVLLLATGVSNLLVVVIWLSKKNRTPVSILLSLISIFDLLTILAGATRSTMAYLVGTIHYVKECYVVAIVGNLAIIFHTLSIFSTTFLAIQRLFVCQFPFVGPRICKLRSTVIQAVASVCIIIIWRSPQFMISDIRGSTITDKDNTTQFICDVNHVLDDETVRKFFKADSMIRLLITGIAPAVVVSFCMFGCLITIYRRKMSTGQHRNNRTILMLVLIMFIFVAGEFPSTVLNACNAFMPNAKLWISTNDGIQFCNITLVLSYLLNVWVYIVMSKQFRESLHNMLCKKKEITESVTSTSVSKEVRITSVSERLNHEG